MRRKLPLFDNPTLKRVHLTCTEAADIAEGVQRIYTFPNGYGASVIQLYVGSTKKISSILGDNGLCWELIVTEVDSGDALNFMHTFATKVANDAVKPLTTTGVEYYLQQIAQLEPRDGWVN